MSVHNSDALDKVEAVIDAFIADIEGKAHGQADIEIGEVFSSKQLKYVRDTIREATGQDPVLLETNDTPTSTWHLMLTGYAPIV